LTTQFVLAGFRHDLDCLLPYLDLVVVPSYSEGLPNVALEACAAGIPVIGTAVGGVPEVIEHGVNGYLVQPGDSHALAQRILEVLESEHKRRALGLSGQQRVATEFTFERQCAKYRELFQGLLGEREQGIRIPPLSRTLRKVW
jgi:glycosyltransferase involved in cell wall biosynthesis